MASFVRPSHFDAYVVKCFVLVQCLVFCHSSQFCGEMSVDLLANRKHLNAISGIFVYAKNAIYRNLGADFMLFVRIEFLCENFAFVLDNEYA